MPGSVAEGKDLVKQFCIDHDIRSVLDVGPGEGTYYFALQGSPVERLDGIEAWAPYINQYGLREKYTNLYIGDIAYFDWRRLPEYDLVILGDVLEHINIEDGYRLIKTATAYATYVALSLPIYGYEQGWGHDGNWFEAHLVQYSDDSVRELLKDYTILESFKGGTVGVYIFTNA